MSATPTRFHWLRYLITVCLVCGVTGLLTICDPDLTHAKVRADVARTTGCVSDAAGDEVPQCVVIGHQLPRRRPAFKLVQPGTNVRPSAVSGPREFLNASDGVALTTSYGADYPVLSTNGGRTWRIAGPPLHVDAADGAEAVQSVGISSPGTFFAYGDSVVDITTNHGRTWQQSVLGEDVVAVAPATGNALLALVEDQATDRADSRVVLSQYVSLDGGRHWRYTSKLQYANPAVERR